MGTIIDFAQERQSRKTNTMALSPALSRNVRAHILLFTGVRFEYSIKKQAQAQLLRDGVKLKDA